MGNTAQCHTSLSTAEPTEENKALRTPEQIREEMKQLRALRPDHCRSTQDLIKLQRFQELYAEWFASLSNQDGQSD